MSDGADILHNELLSVFHDAESSTMQVLGIVARVMNSGEAHPDSRELAMYMGQQLTGATDGNELMAQLAQFNAE